MSVGVGLLKKYRIEYRENTVCYNESDGGDGGGNLGKHLSDETKRKIGDKNRINMTGKKLSEETKLKMSESHKKRIANMSDDEYNKKLQQIYNIKHPKKTEEQKEIMKNNKNSAKLSWDIVNMIRNLYEKENNIGIVTKVTSGYVYTIEGNTSGGSTVVDNGGGVAKKCYERGYYKILSYGRPKYTNTDCPAISAPTSTSTTKDKNGCPYAKPTKTLSYGMYDDGVKWMKWYLNKLIDANILMATKLDHTNNYWGDTTSITVKGFQTLYPTTGTKNKPDGQFGSKCVEMAFNEVSKLNAKKTYEQANPKCYLPKTLPKCGYWQKGDNTKDTLRVKKFLLWVYPNSGITVQTGLYGDNTVKHVKAFQSAHGINPSGCWNASTQKAAEQYKK